ncbi:tetratricopeptide repeat protein [Actinoplanes sp. NPDC051513]|uniref:tetratricopeptide repeat protein n=1 Tax=Actinoplanes sp. NPDC051513 TaxID=3363908 RepID=UPI0037B19712
MTEETTSAAEALRSFCSRLRRLRLEAGGPSIDSLARNPAIPRGRSQLYAVLNGEVKEPPQWDFVRPYVETCVTYARQHGNVMSLPVDPARWRAELNTLVEIFDAERRRRRVDEDAPVATESLPPDIVSFVGRHAEIEALLAAKEAVLLLDGMPGVGKTAIAVHAAHQLGDRFPDGRLFLNLCGHRPDRKPLTTAEALAALLGAVGVPPAVMPVDTDARAAIWRHQTHDKRFLLLLDDAVDAAQVEPLIPSAPGSLVLITSRNRMPGLVHAQPLRVDTLTPDEASDLFAAIAGGEKNEAVRTVVARCGYLPLQVSLLAARLRMHPSWSVERLLEELGGDGAANAPFDVSYGALDPTLRESFRRLSVHPGVDLDAWAAAAVLDTRRDVAAARLEGLYANHLIDEASQDRFRFHDLIREYAIRRGDDDTPAERERAEGRLLRYFLHTAREACSFYATRPRPAERAAPGPPVNTHESATRWLRAEVANIAGCVARSWERHPAEVAALSDAVFPYLRQAGPWDLALQVHETGVRAARRTGEGVAAALMAYGLACTLADRYADAIAALRESADLAESGVDRADALNYLGMALRFDGRFAAATAVLTDAARSFAELGDPTGETMATTSLAVTARLSGDYQRAHDIAARAAATSRRSTYLPCRATALAEYGVTQYLLARYEPAAATLTAARDLARGLENRLGEATALNYLGPAQYLGGHYTAAIDSLTGALEIFRQLGERLGSADALSQLGVARCLAGEHETAAACQRRAIEQFRDLGNPLGEAVARNELGNALHHLGRPADARTEIIAAIAVLRDLDYRPGLEEALNNLGRVELTLGRPAEAAARHREALALSEHTNVPLERARAHEGIGRSSSDQAHLRAALATYREVKSPLAAALLRDFPELADFPEPAG